MKNYFKLQQEIAVEAARLIFEEEIDTLSVARTKAAHTLRSSEKKALPDDKTILTQLEIHRSLYSSVSQREALKNLRRVALNAMRLLTEFKPQLIGSVLQGYAHEQSSIDILVRADSTEDIAIQLMKHQIPYQLKEKKLYFSRQTSAKSSHSSYQARMKESVQHVPAYQFYADKNKINLIVLIEKNRKRVPVVPENGQTIQRASIIQLEELLAK